MDAFFGGAFSAVPFVIYLITDLDGLFKNKLLLACIRHFCIGAMYPLWMHVVWSLSIGKGFDGWGGYCSRWWSGRLELDAGFGVGPFIMLPVHVEEKSQDRQPDIELGQV